MLCCGGGSAREDDTGSQSGGEMFKVLEGRWDIDKEAIGEGGFGTVHLCRHRRTGKPRACKAMRLPTPMDREDFRHEVHILKKIKIHHNICHIVDSAEDARFGYLVMQSCSGGELFDRIAARKCTEKDAAMAVLDVLSALDFIHARRIIHRDLKVCFPLFMSPRGTFACPVPPTAMHPLTDDGPISMRAAREPPLQG